MKQLVSAILISLSTACFAQAETNAADATQEVIETFTPPKPISKTPPYYPVGKQRKGQEGWVQLNFMVSPEGKTYDITIVDSTDPAFERAAIKAAEQFVYEPALLNDQAIDAGVTNKITFALAGIEPGAQRGFVSRFKKLTSAIQSDQKAEADQLFAELSERPRNLYEEAYFQLATYQYLAYTEAPLRRQHNALALASNFNRHEDYLPEDTVTSLMSTRLQLELKLNELARAQRTANEILEREISDQHRDFAESIITQIEEIKASERPFAVADTIRPDNRGVHLLLKNTFSFPSVDGDMAELRLHCDKGYVGFIYKPDIAYSISSDWNSCWLTMIGTPGTNYVIEEGARSSGELSSEES